MIKPLIFALCVVFAFDSVCAQTPAWQPSPRHTQIPIWPGAVPDAQPAVGTEVTATAKNLVARRPWDYVENVSRPTMTVYSPTGKNTGTAVVVFPGGSYQVRAFRSTTRAGEEASARDRFRRGCCPGRVHRFSSRTRSYWCCECRRADSYQARRNRRVSPAR